MTGTTLPLSEPTGDPAEVRERSRQRYGTARADVEAAIVKRLKSQDGTPMTGRRKRGGQQ